MYKYDTAQVETCTTYRVARTRYNVFLSWELRTFTSKNEVRKVRGALKLPASIVFLEHFFPNILSFTVQKVGMSFVELSDMHKNLNSIFTTCKPYYFPWGTQNVMNFDTLRSGIKLVRICKIFILFLRCEVIAIAFGFLLSRCIISILYHYHYLSLCTINAVNWCIRLLFRLYKNLIIIILFAIVNQIIYHSISKVV